MSEDERLSGLVGVRIESALQTVEQGNLVVWLVAVDGRIGRVTTHGDCCAWAYILHVSNGDALNMAEVTRVEPMGGRRSRDGAEGEGEVVDEWGHVIHTTRGTCTLECRTEHNGYYSGWAELDWRDAVPDGAVPLEDR